MDKSNIKSVSGMGHWLTYDGADGLADNWVWAVFQDHDGYLWFGTECGVCRYDGVSFTTFTTNHGLAHNSVVSICQDRKGHLWFGTRGGGVSCYDGKEWRTLTIQDGLPNDWVEVVAQDKTGCLWIGTRGGLCCYDGQNWQTFTTEDGLTDNHVMAVLPDDAGNLWARMYDGSVSCYDGQVWTAVVRDDGSADDFVGAMVQDQKGHIWFGTQRGICRFDGDAWRGLSENDVFKDRCLLPLLQDWEGCVWFFDQERGGVKCYDGQVWQTFDTDNGLSNETVFSGLQDREGFFWFCTGGGGICCYGGASFTTFTTEQGLVHNDIQTIYQDRQGQLWFATRGGVSCYDGMSWSSFTEADGLVNDLVKDMVESRDGRLWFGTRGGGVSCFDGQVWKSYTTSDGLVHNSVWGVVEDLNNCLWVATRGGVSCFDGQVWKNYTPSDGLAHHDIRKVYLTRDGRLWFGSFEGGVSCYDGDRWQTFTAQDGLAQNSIHTIFQDRDGRMWFGTRGGGVSCYDGHFWRTFTTQDGLAHNVVVSIAQSQEGHLWFGTFGGVSRYDGQIFQTMTEQDGLPSNSVWTIFEDGDKALWFGTANGLTRFQPPKPIPPSVGIDTVVADRRYRLDQQGGEEALAVSGTGGMVAFEFHGMSFKTRANGLVYRYRLLGEDDVWKTTRQQRVEFQDLTLGTYTFEVQAIDRDMNYSEPDSILLTLKPDPHLEGLFEVLSSGEIGQGVVGKSTVLRQVQIQFEEVGKTDVTILILGETGTGKSLAAKTIHAMSKRHAGPLIQVNCGAIPEGLIESELFGHERGAFTGSVSRKLGKVELAATGTLFLDEIGDLALPAQVKLLRLLEEGEFERVGGTTTLRPDVRIVAATNRDLKEMVADGQFREDLYFRLCAFPVQMPPLRDRREDIPFLTSHFLNEMATRLHKKVTHLAPEALAVLMAYDWPGNVRELEYAIQRAVIICKTEVIQSGDIVLNFDKSDGGVAGETVSLEEHERRYIRKILEQTQWTVSGPRGAAALLDINPSTLRSRIKKLGIRR